MFVSDACARIMDQIEVEGIFRKAGSTARQKEIRVGLISIFFLPFCFRVVKRFYLFQTNRRNSNWEFTWMILAM